MKYSSNFERDYNWMLKYRDKFTFSGSLPQPFNIDLKNGKPAKECFFIRESRGKKEFDKISTNEPDLLKSLILCKESINFNIKMWAEDRAKGYLPKVLFEDTIKELELLPWMIEAVENQKIKYY